jgi:hypothetical protein
MQHIDSFGFSAKSLGSPEPDSYLLIVFLCLNNYEVRLLIMDNFREKG